MTTTASRPNHRQFLKSLSPIVVRGPKDVHRLTPFLNQMVSEYAIDTETTGLHPIENRVRLIQIATNTDVVVVDLDGFRHNGERQVDWAQPGLDNLRVIVQSANTIKVLQNAAFDINMLAGEGLTVGGPIFDTMVASKLINAGLANKNGLGDIVARVLKLELPKELQKADWAGEITDEMIGYAARDAAVLLRLVSPLKSSLVHSQVASDITLYDIFRLEMSCLRAVASMQFRGFNFDKPRAEALRETMQGEAEKLKLAFLEALDAQIRRKNPNSPDIYLPRESDGSFNTREKTTGSVRLGTKQFAGFNPRSNPQMAQRFKQAGILLPPDAKGNPSLDQNILAFQRKEQPLIEAYLTWKGAATLVSHVDSLLEHVASTGRIHGNYKQMGTDTGRLSASTPNLQQVPSDKEFRSLFIPALGYKLLVADFSQVELRVAAHLSREPRMIEAYQAGRDLHTETAMLITGKPQEAIEKAERQSAKVCFSGDTEILTAEHGWVRLDSYSGGAVAQYMLPPGVELNQRVRKPGPGYVAGARSPWNGDNGSVIFVEPLHYDSFDSTDVWHASDRNIDVTATGNHEILYIDAYGNAHKRALSEVISPYLMVAAGYKGLGELVLSELRTRLLVMVTADGSFKQSPGYVSLGFSKRRKIRRCEELLNELGITYSKNKYSNGEHQDTTFFKFKLTEASWLLDYVNTDKVLNFKNCMEHIDALTYLCEAQYWDGTCIEGSARDRIRVGTVVKETADVMQAMAVTSGLPCTVHTQDNPECTNGKFYTVSYAFRTTPVWRPSWEPVKAPDQRVYCVQVPSDLILIRRNGKVSVQGNCNFGLLYGAGPATLQKQAVAQYGIDMEFAYAKELVTKFRQAYPTLYAWQRETGEGTAKYVLTATGRRRFLVGFNDKFTTRINTRVQGTAGDITKLALANLWENIEDAPEGEALLIAVVHDEIVMEVREDQTEKWAKLLKTAMEAAGNYICFRVPIIAEVGVGDTWAEAK
jgi:DNA polymerase I-like protein with 3'-5' exonuclease and polymerase domains